MKIITFAVVYIAVIKFPILGAKIVVRTTYLQLVKKEKLLYFFNFHAYQMPLSEVQPKML